MRLLLFLFFLFFREQPSAFLDRNKMGARKDLNETSKTNSYSNRGLSSRVRADRTHNRGITGCGSPAGNTAERTSAVPAAPDVSPAPGGGNPGFTTAEGLNALKNLISGIGNSAFGWYCLFSDTTASYNTGLGAGILALNTGGGEYCQRRRRAHPEHGRDEEHREWSRCDGVQHYRQR